MIAVGLSRSPCAAGSDFCLVFNADGDSWGRNARSLPMCLTDKFCNVFYTAESSSVFSTMNCDEVEVSSSGSSLLLTLASVSAVIVVGLLEGGPRRKGCCKKKSYFIIFVIENNQACVQARYYVLGYLSGSLAAIGRVCLSPPRPNQNKEDGTNRAKWAVTGLFS